MTNKNCVHSDCKSDSRNEPGKSYQWANFVKPKSNLTRARLWIRICNRPGFGVKDIKPHSYICQLHFPPNTYDFKWFSNPNLTPLPKNYQGYESIDTLEPNQPNSRKRKHNERYFTPIAGPTHSGINSRLKGLLINDVQSLVWMVYFKNQIGIGGYIS